jgi:hypothetical protein
MFSSTKKVKQFYLFLTNFSNTITYDEWNFFLRGTMTDYSNEVFEEDWIDKLTWEKILGIEETHYNFRDLAKSFQDPGINPS